MLYSSLSDPCLCQALHEIIRGILSASGWRPMMVVVLILVLILVLRLWLILLLWIPLGGCCHIVLQGGCGGRRRDGMMSRIGFSVTMVAVLLVAGKMMIEILQVVKEAEVGRRCDVAREGEGFIVIPMVLVQVGIVVILMCCVGAMAAGVRTRMLGRGEGGGRSRGRSEVGSTGSVERILRRRRLSHVPGSQEVHVVGRVQ